MDVRRNAAQAPTPALNRGKCRFLVTRRLAAPSRLISNQWLGNVQYRPFTSTSGLAPKQQIQCWTDALTELCGQFDIDPLEASSLEGQINYTTVSRLKLCQIETSQHRLAHPHFAGEIRRTSLRQDPVSDIWNFPFRAEWPPHRLMPGDCLAYDVSCPHTIISPSLTRHEVVIVPKDLLEERGFHSAKMSACKLSARTGTGRIAYDFSTCRIWRSTEAVTLQRNRRG